MILGCIQARVNSTRLPGKIQRMIGPMTMFDHVVSRARDIPRIDQHVVLTSEHPSDDWVVAQCQRLGVDCLRGPFWDVLTRFEMARRVYTPTHIVRLTADCPFLDPVVSAQVIDLHLTTHADYTTNTCDWPDGLDTEVFTAATLERAYYATTDPVDREHVTLWMRRTVKCVELELAPRAREWKWSVDEESELEYVREFYGVLGGHCSWKEIINADPGKLCPKCAEGYPHRKYPLGSIMQKSLDQPMVTAWDLHANKIPDSSEGYGLAEDPECLAPEIAKRRATLRSFWRDLGGAGSTSPGSSGCHSTSVSG